MQWAGRRCLVWVSVVGSGQLQRALALLDSTVVEQGDLVLPGLWDRGNWFVFQVHRNNSFVLVHGIIQIAEGD